jgi:hypothetical protein
MKVYGKLFVLALAVVALAVTGCKTTQPGVTNNFGTLQTLVEAPPQAVTRAATESMQDLDLVVVSSQASNISGEVIGRTPDDSKVSVTVTPRPNNLCEISVRVGTMGDTATSQRIINRIKAKLYGAGSQNAPSNAPTQGSSGSSSQF